MAANILTKNNTDQLAKWYGEGPHYILAQTMLGGGAAANLSNGPINSATASVPPCAVEIVSGVHTATGTYTITLSDVYYAIADCRACVDDVNGSTPVLAFCGQWANLGAANPASTTSAVATFVLTTYNSSLAAVDVALNTPVRFLITFKKDLTGAAA
jgi:hypothetical protein